MWLGHALVDLEPGLAAYALGELALSLQIAVSNALVVWVYASRSVVRTPTNTYMFSLAVTDFLAGAVGVPMTVFSVLTRAPHTFEACLLVHLILCVLCTVSTFHLLAIAVDKYLTICCRCQLWLDQRARHRRARALIVVAWLAGTMVGLMPVFDVFEFSSRNRMRFRGECRFTLVVDYRYLVYVIFFATIIVPSLIIILCYTAIYRRIRVEERQVKCLLRASERRRRMRNRRKLIRTLLLLVCTYAVCWFPLYLINTYDLFRPAHRSGAGVTLFAVVLSHANCALNPLIYAYGMPGFKHTLRQFVGVKSHGTLRSPLMAHFSQLPLPATPGQTRAGGAAKPGTPRRRDRTYCKFSWSQLGQSMESVDSGPTSVKRPLGAIREASHPTFM